MLNYFLSSLISRPSDANIRNKLFLNLIDDQYMNVTKNI